jgi:hypothetical protein
LRVTRTGDSWRFDYSYDGANWITAGTFVQVLNVSSVGVFGGNHSSSGSAPAHTAEFDYFFETGSPVVPEDGP